MGDTLFHAKKRTLPARVYGSQRAQKSIRGRRVGPPKSQTLDDRSSAASSPSKGAQRRHNDMAAEKSSEKEGSDSVCAPSMSVPPHGASTAWFAARMAPRQEGSRGDNPPDSHQSQMLIVSEPGQRRDNTSGGGGLWLYNASARYEQKDAYENIWKGSAQ